MADPGIAGVRPESLQSTATMRETWLSTNRRAIYFGCVPPLVAAFIGAWLMVGLGEEDRSAWRWLGALTLVFSIVTLGVLLRHVHRPRVAFERGKVLFFLRTGPPIAIPADIVEAFFAGQSSAHLPGPAKQTQTVNLIARLSRRHTEWAECHVKPALGQWCDSYVTIRGTWCEPLDAEVIRRLNRRLKEVKTDREPRTNND